MMLQWDAMLSVCLTCNRKMQKVWFEHYNDITYKHNMQFYIKAKRNRNAVWLKSVFLFLFMKLLSGYLPWTVLNSKEFFYHKLTFFWSLFSFAGLCNLWFSVEFHSTWIISFLYASQHNRDLKLLQIIWITWYVIWKTYP